MSSSEIGLEAGDQLTPSFERAKVSDAMRHGIISCPPGIPLRAVARMMATNHVHSVVITGQDVDRSGHSGEHAWGVVTDMDLTRSAGAAEDLMAGEVATIDVPTVHPDTPLAEAARTMGKLGVGHLVVVTPLTNRPVGVISTLDVAGNLAWARG